MVDSTQDTTGFLPLDLTADALPLDSTAQLTPDALLTPDTASSGGSGFDALSSIPTLIGMLAQLISPITTALAEIAGAHPLEVMTSLAKHAERGVRAADPSMWLELGAPEVVVAGQKAGDAGITAEKVWEWVSSIAGGAWYTALLKFGLEVDMDNFDAQAKRGISTTDTLIGFVVAMQYGIGFLDSAATVLLGERWAKPLMEVIAKIPEEMGLSWALGLTIEKGFDAAVGESINRAIRRAKRPGEPAWPIVRTMLRQHVIDDAGLTEVLENEGYKQEWIDKIKALEFQPLPIGDIQALFQAGIITADQIDPLMIALGFKDDIRGWLKQLYIEKAETSSGAEIRVVARSLFRQGLISESDYRSHLTEVNFPEKLIADDIKAINLEKSTGWRSQSVAVIKSDYLHNPGSQSTAVSKLMQVGYPQTDAQDMVNSWTAPPIRRQHGLTEAQILKYYVAGIQLNPDAKTQLISIGLTPDAAQFLLEHPLSASKVHVVQLTPALVTQAYLVGAIQQSDLQANFEKAGAKGDTLQYLIDTAKYKYAHHHESGSGQTPLSEGHILTLFKLGIWDQPTATTALEGEGYSAANALLLLEIENKGPIKPPSPPLFSSVGGAMDYLSTLGFAFLSPEDPSYAAALGMVEQAGFTPVPPPNFTPPRLLEGPIAP